MTFSLIGLGRTGKTVWGLPLGWQQDEDKRGRGSGSGGGGKQAVLKSVLFTTHMKIPVHLHPCSESLRKLSK